MNDGFFFGLMSISSFIPENRLASSAVHGSAAYFPISIILKPMLRLVSHRPPHFLLGYQGKAALIVGFEAPMAVRSAAESHVLKEEGRRSIWQIWPTSSLFHHFVVTESAVIDPNIYWSSTKKSLAGSEIINLHALFGEICQRHLSCSGPYSRGQRDMNPPSRLRAGSDTAKVVEDLQIIMLGRATKVTADGGCDATIGRLCSGG